jgi:hypothetical protein
VQFSPVKRSEMVFTNSIQTENGGITVGYSCVDVCIQLLRKETAERALAYRKKGVSQRCI